MGYLDQYGVADARKERRIRRVLLAVAAVALASGSLYLWFKNYREEQQVGGFLTMLEKGDYPAAYTFWGCRVEAPCKNYDYKSFLEDWGPSSPVGKLASYRLGVSRARGSGVEIPVALNGRPPVKLWVEHKDRSVGFAPLF